jgi:hypothetical protein
MKDHFINFHFELLPENYWSLEAALRFLKKPISLGEEKLACGIHNLK